MTKSIFTLLIAILSLSVSAQGIEFVETTWQDALELAKQENKLLFVDSYAQWCGPCKRMAKHEFVKSEVGEIYNENFINLKLDMETKNGRTFDSKYPVSAYPTMFFLNGDGEVVKKVRGGKKAAQLVEMAKLVIRSYDTSGKWKEKYDAGDRSFDVVYNYVSALNLATKPSLKISNDYLKSNPDITEDQRNRFYFAATVDADSRIFDKMVEHKKAIIKLETEKKYNDKVKSACKRTVDKAIEYETESLLIEAVDKATQHLTLDGEQFALECKLDYYSAIKDPKIFGESAKKLSKIYLKSDPTKMSTLVRGIQTKFRKDKKLIDQSVGYAKKYHKKVATEDSAILYARSLMLVEKYDDAEDVVIKAIKEAEKDKKKSKKLILLQKQIEKKKA